MKLALLFSLCLAGHVAMGASTVTPMKIDQCQDAKGNIKPDSHCVCYTGKTSCPGSNSSTCSEKRCDQRTCTDDNDCAQVSAKCVDKFCKK